MVKMKGKQKFSEEIKLSKYQIMLIKTGVVHII